MGSPLARSVSLPVTADESLVGKEGYLVYPKGSAGSEELALADDGATQAANQALAILGVCIAGAAANATAEARQTGVVDCIAGTGGVTIGDYIVAETGTGKGITLGAANSGINYVAGQALTSASADGYFQLDLDARCVFFGSAGFGAGSTSTLDMDDAAATLTGALAAADIYAVDPNSAGASETLTTDTAANLISAGVVTAANPYRKALLINTGGEHITLAAGANVTISNSTADLVIEDSEFAVLHWWYQGASDVRLAIVKAESAT